MKCPLSKANVSLLFSRSLFHVTNFGQALQIMSENHCIYLFNLFNLSKFGKYCYFYSFNQTCYFVVFVVLPS